VDVSVVLPVKNGGEYIKSAVGSTLAQENVDFELIIVDDGSTDSTLDITAAFERSDPRVKVYKNPGSGLVDALNFGISSSRAQLIARMDADDVNLPRRLSMQTKYLEENPDCVVVGTFAQTIDVAGASKSRLTFPTTDDGMREALQIGCPILHPSAMFRRPAVMGVGGYRREFPVGEDVDLWLRMAEAGQLANLPEYLVQYRLHDDSVSVRRVVQAAASGTMARYLADRRRNGFEDRVEATASADAIAELGPDWWALYHVILLYLMTGRGGNFPNYSDMYDKVMQICADRSIRFDIRQYGVYALLHAKRGTPKLIATLMLGDFGAFLKSLPFVLRMKTRR
jgi:glycosyltransferase involved in cell wall biosynthesis